MNHFLKDVAQDIINKKYNLNDTCFIVPNKRTDTFFKKNYASILGKAEWAPKIFTIEIFLSRLAKLKNTDKLQLIILLYKIARKIFSQDSNNLLENYSFDKFYSIAEIIINDFNDIDNYLIDPEYLFKNIKDLQEIDLYYYQLPEYYRELLKEFWMSFSLEKTSQEKLKFLAIWEKLPAIYKEFNNMLINKKIAYSGLVNKHIKYLIDNNLLNTNNYKNYIFIGFNALNKAEKYIFNFFAEKLNAKFYWDYDEFYTNDKKQEAGMFMRENIFKFPNQIKIKQNNIENNNSEIQFIGVPLNVGQAKNINEILNSLEKKDPEYYNKTAIILTDETMLFPILHSLNQNIPDINITMGYPLKDTILYSLLINYIEIQEHTTIYKQNNILFYHKDIIKILKNPNVWNKIPELANAIINLLIEKNKVYTDYKFFADYKNDFLNIIFQPVILTDKPTNNLLNNILNILFAIFEKNTINNIENEYIYQVYTQVKRLKDTIEQQHEEELFNLNISIRLIKQIFANIRIPFDAEFEKGLQIIGLMETRNLDFENIIIVNANEGTLPNEHKKQTFISDTIRIAFELPSIKQQDAIFAYLFYRLFQKSKNIFILYNNITGNNNGEISRFLQQLKYETKLNIVEKQFKDTLKPNTINKIEIHKDQDIINALNIYIKEYNQNNKKFSASAINTYIDCSLKFYFKYIANLKPKQNIEEEINQITFGNLLHTALEYIYLKLAENKNSKLIEHTDFVFLFQNVENAIEYAFKQHYKTEENIKFAFENTNIIVKDVLIQYIKNILHLDKNYAPFEIIDLEQKNGYYKDMEINANQQNFNITIWGVFDRIDKKNNVYRIVDYKTGTTEKSFSSTEELFDTENTNRQTAILQILLYSEIYQNKLNSKDNNIIPAIYNIRDIIKKDFIPNIVFKKDTKNKIIIDNLQLPIILKEFNANLKSLISKIFDPNIPFSQTTNENICKYCDYNQICNK